MLKLSDIFDQLAYGELSATGILSDGAITGEEINKVIAHINLGLTELHKRFVLKRKTLTLQTRPGQTRYVLLSRYAQSTGAVNPIILDSAEPFQDDIIEVLRLTNSNGVELPFDGRNPSTDLMDWREVPLVVQPAYNIIRFVEDPVAATYEVSYQANHPRIAKVSDFLNFDASTVDVELPMTHLEALLCYIASRVITPIANNLGNPGEAMNYSARFEQLCKELEVQGLDVQSMAGEDRFTRKGFV